MEKIKSTEELADLLKTERIRSMKIQCECSPLKGPGVENPEWEEILKFNYENSVKALDGYWDIKEQVHEYQKEHNVSGIFWKEWTYQGKTINCPTLHDQLIAIPGDKNILSDNSESVWKWWICVTRSLELWQSLNNADTLTNMSEIIAVKNRAEWIETFIVSGLSRWEIYISFNWGELNPDPKGVAFYAVTSEISTTVLEKLVR